MSEQPMSPPRSDLVAQILATAERHRDRTAIVDHRGRRTSYGQLAAGARAVAAHLVGQGLPPGAGVLLATRASVDAMAAALGVLLASGVVVIADPGAGAALSAVRRRLVPVGVAVAEPVVHLAGSGVVRTLLGRRSDRLQLPDLSTPGMHHLVSGRPSPWARLVVPRGAVFQRRLLRRHDPNPSVAVPSDPDRDALVVFTSGSTDDPRAVVHTVASLSAGVQAATVALGLDDTVVMHTDQMMIGLPVLASGGCWSLPPTTASPRAWSRQAVAAGATHGYAIPRAVLAAAHHPWPPSLRWIGMGGAPVLPGVVREVLARHPQVQVHGVYGMTEVLPVAVATAEQILASPAGTTSLGHPVPGITIRIAAQDGDTTGEIMISGPQAHRGHVGLTAGPEVASGDLGRRRPDGELLLSGRAKNMIIRGQVNLYPELVEPLLLQRHPELTDCALVGVGDPVTGDEAVVLAIAVRPGVAATAVASAIQSAWTEVADEGWRPDRVVAVPRVARRGRSAAVDLAAVRAAIGSAT